MDIAKQGEDLIITGAGFFVTGTVITAIGSAKVFITSTDTGLELIASLYDLTSLREENITETEEKRY
ncbi:hypothetical protein [Peribacillus huizhouensis]|uniref:Uncharacterized protein n=1 Tax=Peribacillus huizhouensis TaxID=1501239 RepID=A0ABR6CNE6_9BACI|nr:hypothetical protein [Peribacillus huizhouensis]MBA9026543.1 hypothetical protein [Peribacillus huizhouensis]